METLQRLCYGLSIGAFTLFLLYNTDTWYGILAFFAVLGLSFMALGEFYLLAQRSSEERPFRKTGFFFAFCCILFYYSHYLHKKAEAGLDLGAVFVFAFLADFARDARALHLVPLLMVFLVICAGILQVTRRPVRGAIYSLSVTVFGLVYLVLSFCQIFMLLLLENSFFYLLLFLLLPIGADSGAYFAGKFLPARPIGLKASPQKSYTGYVGGLVAALCVGLVFVWSCREFAPAAQVSLGYIEAIFLALCIAVFSIFGDLLESVLKRDAQIKDSSRLIPGHGGVLDLVDTICWSLPLGYFYLFLRSLYFP